MKSLQTNLPAFSILLDEKCKNKAYFALNIEEMYFEFARKCKQKILFVLVLKLNQKFKIWKLATLNWMNATIGPTVGLSLT